ncbi:MULTISPECIES: DUF4339 domain-containing protein [Luteimonas]|uniref:DUF4339 domain-containing protein n=1 Tax=Luteimonas cellulosilyticus TaxID=2683586 RepID=UPI000C7E3A6B
MNHWYYTDARNTRHGPVTQRALLQLREEGIVGDATLVWRDGLAGWLPARWRPSWVSQHRPASTRGHLNRWLRLLPGPRAPRRTRAGARSPPPPPDRGIALCAADGPRGLARRHRPRR